MKIERFPNGALDVNTYLVYSEITKKSLVIDPSYEIEPVISRISELGLRVVYIINTHGHVDHIAGNARMKEATGAKILVHKITAPALISPNANLSSMLPPIIKSPPADKLVIDGDEIRIDDDIALKVLHTPGHCPGHICLRYSGGVFTGDVLFAGSIGRTDFPSCDIYQMRDSLRRLNNEIPDDFDILPGHSNTSKHSIEKQKNYLYKRMIQGDLNDL